MTLVEFTIITVSDPLIKDCNLGGEMQKRAAEGLIWLIGAASVKYVAGPEGVSWEQALWLAEEAPGKPVDSPKPH